MHRLRFHEWTHLLSQPLPVPLPVSLPLVESMLQTVAQACDRDLHLSVAAALLVLLRQRLAPAAHTCFCLIWSSRDTTMCCVQGEMRARM